MKLKVEYVHDGEANNWSFHVPALHIVGGGDPTKAAAEAHCLDAIAFAFESIADEAANAPGEIVEYDVQVKKVS